MRDRIEELAKRFEVHARRRRDERFPGLKHEPLSVSVSY
jgi:hypothetical protein